MLQCCACKETKPFELFTKRPDRPRGYMYHCKACQVVRSRNSAEKARQNYLARRREQYKERAQVLRAKAVERYYRYRDRNLERAKKYKKENKEVIRALNNARKRRARLSTPLWANKNKIKELYYFASQWNTIWPEDRVHVDHIIPLKGKYVTGLHVEANLQIIRAADNMRKSNKLLDISST